MAQGGRRAGKRRPTARHPHPGDSLATPIVASFFVRCFKGGGGPHPGSPLHKSSTWNEKCKLWKRQAQPTPYKMGPRPSRKKRGPKPPTPDPRSNITPPHGIAAPWTSIGSTPYTCPTDGGAAWARTGTLRSWWRKSDGFGHFCKARAHKKTCSANLGEHGSVSPKHTQNNRRPANNNRSLALAGRRLFWVCFWDTDPCSPRFAKHGLFLIPTK